jgi:hypothetical protein
MLGRKPLSSIAELTARVRAFAQDRGWEQFHTPKNLAMALAGEVGELLQVRMVRRHHRP